MQRRGSVWLVVVLVVLTALAGLSRLREDGQRAFCLEQNSPLVALNARLVEQTGGDHLVLALLLNEDGLLNSEGVAAIEEVRELMAGEAGLTRVQAVTVLPLLQSVDGVLSAVTPLRPPPSSEAAWQAARSRILSDPLLADQLISAD